MSSFSDNWRDDLKRENYEAWVRLCECHNTRTDLKNIAKRCWKENRTKHTKEECLDHIIEWICGDNNQVSLIPDDDEYKKILDYMC